MHIAFVFIVVGGVIRLPAFDMAYEGYMKLAEGRPQPLGSELQKMKAAEKTGKIISRTRILKSNLQNM